MPTEMPRILVEIRYHQAAQDYLRRLPKEHFMEATPQATQREITVESLSLVHAQWPKLQYFNELLVQYPRLDSDNPNPGQVVPDNMVVLHDQPIQAIGSYDVPLQPARPFWMLEYVSKSSRRKDYDDNMLKYEHELKVPYYLLFAPEAQELTLYRHTGEKYVTVVPNGNGRHALAELEMEVVLLDGWMRFWFRGELLPLPPDLLRDLRKARRQIQQQEEQLHQQKEQLHQQEQQLHQAQHKLEEEMQMRLAAERRTADELRQMEQQRQRAETLAAEVERLRQLLAQRGA